MSPRRERVTEVVPVLKSLLSLDVSHYNAILKVSETNCKCSKSTVECVDIGQSELDDGYWIMIYLMALRSRIFSR